MKRVQDLFLLVTTIARLAWANNSELITELTDKNFGETIGTSKYAIVEFYAPWCGFCQEFAPIYEEAAKRIKEVNDTVLVAKINADQFEEVAEQNDIEGLPTIKWFVNGSDKYEYNGSPSMYVFIRIGSSFLISLNIYYFLVCSESFMRWIEKITTSPSKELKTPEDVEKYGDVELSVTGIFDKYEGDIYEAFTELALLTDDIVFFKTLNATLMKVESAPALIFQKNLPGHATEVIRKSLDGNDDPGEEIYSFLDKHRYPDYYIFDSSKVEDMMNVLQQVDREYHIHIIVPDGLLKDRSMLEIAREAGRQIRDKATLVLSANDEKSPLNSAFDVKNTQDIQIFAAHTLSIRKYALPISTKEAFEPASVIDFTKSIESGDNKHRVYASGPDPQAKEENGVLVAIRHNLREIVQDPTKDVVVLSHHPDSDESLELEESFENLAKAFAEIPSIKLVKFDASLNEHELIDYAMEDLPMVTLFKASKSSEPTVMDAFGELDIESVGKFIHENAAINFSLPDLSEYRVASWDDWNDDDEGPDDMGDEDDDKSVVHEEL